MNAALPPATNSPKPTSKAARTAAHTTPVILTALGATSALFGFYEMSTWNEAPPVWYAEEVFLGGCLFFVIGFLWLAQGYGRRMFDNRPGGI